MDLRGDKVRTLYGKTYKFGRAEGDFYPTPAWVVERLLKIFPVDKFDVICDPCAGRGDILDVMPDTVAAYGGELMPEDKFERTSDAVTYGRDFFEEPVDLYRADAIITNPPFSLAIPFIERSLLCAPKVAMLLPVKYLAGMKRAEFFAKNKPSVVGIIPERIDFLELGGAPMENHAWFIFERNFTGKTELTWLT